MTISGLLPAREYVLVIALTIILSMTHFSPLTIGTIHKDRTVSGQIPIHMLMNAPFPSCTSNVSTFCSCVLYAVVSRRSHSFNISSHALLYNSIVLIDDNIGYMELNSWRAIEYIRYGNLNDLHRERVLYVCMVLYMEMWLQNLHDVSAFVDFVGLFLFNYVCCARAATSVHMCVVCEWDNTGLEVRSHVC